MMTVRVWPVRRFRYAYLIYFYSLYLARVPINYISDDEVPLVPEPGKCIAV
jgi:hypothetical protein